MSVEEATRYGLAPEYEPGPLRPQPVIELVDVAHTASEDNSFGIEDVDHGGERPGQTIDVTLNRGTCTSFARSSRLDHVRSTAFGPVDP